MSRPAANKSRGVDKGGSRGAPGSQSVAAAAPVSNDIIPGRLNESDWIRLVTDEDDTNFLGSLVDEVLEKSLDECYNKYISNQLIPYTVNHARLSILQLVEWHFLSRDVGEVNIGNDERWKEDSEPEAAAIDSWAQGSVPVVVRPQSSLAPSISAISEGHTFIPEPTQALHDGDDTVSLPTEAGIPDEATTADGEVVDRDTVQTKTKSKTPTKEFIVKPPSEAKYAKPTDPKKKKKRVYKRHTGRLPPLPASDFETTSPKEDKPDDEEASKIGMHLSPSQKSLIKSQAGRPPGNREVTFDERGNVIGVMKLNVQTLPTHRVRVHYNIIDPAADAKAQKLTKIPNLRTKKATVSEPKTDKKSTISKTTTDAQKSKPFGSRSKSESSASYKTRELGISVPQFPPSQPLVRNQKDIRSFVRERKVLGARFDPLPPLLIDTIDVSPGVVIHEGDHVKKGPEEKYPISVFRSLHKKMSDHTSSFRVLGDNLSQSLSRPIIDPREMVQTVQGAPGQTIFAVSPGIQPLSIVKTAET